MSEEKPRADRVYVEESILGVFGLNGRNEIVEKALYPPDPKRIAAALGRQRAGEVTREAKLTIEKLIQRGFTRFIFGNRALADAARNRWEIEVGVEAATEAGAYLRDNLEKLAVDLGVAEDAGQLYALSHEVASHMARKAVEASLSEREATIGQTVQLLRDLDRTLNVLSGRLRGWYGLHFPELDRRMDDHRTYAEIVKEIGPRTQFEPDALAKFGISAAKARGICGLAEDSMGAQLEPGDMARIRELADHLVSLYRYRNGLEGHVSAVASEVAPNLSEVAGPVLAARLIEKAGGLRKLSMKPSSTIQLLGAEKAMFRALKSGSKPPKHGLIFQHSVVHSSPRRLRGKAARTLAAKLAIAARADAFSGKSLGSELKDELDSAMEKMLGKNNNE